MVISMQTDDETPFQTLGVAALKVLETLITQREKNRDERHAKRHQERNEQQATGQHSEDVDRSLCHVTPI
jgi:hypothetical protein